LGERIELQLRYMRLRAPLEFSFWVEGDRALLECVASQIPPDLFPLIMDCSVAGTCIAHLAKLKPRPYELEVWLSYPERPHHQELRALVGGPIVFEAPCNRIAFPARDLALRIEGDSQLGALMRTQLDAQLEQVNKEEQHSVLDEVRQRLLTRLGGDASLERIARDLRMSGRSLRRQLSALGASFQELLAEVRRERALAYLADTDEAIEQVAARLGYGDPSNFRRAFRRWTGVAPAVFRAQRRRRARTAV
jgi:AraC-like DNA-binding protein